MKSKDAQNLLSIPGVGKRIAEDFRALDVRRVSDLKGKNPEKMYADLCFLQGKHIDRCMLYVMRCAVYYAENFSSFAEASADRPSPLGKSSGHDPDLLKWWNWSDDKSHIEG